jgi:hypothetical protein
LIPAFRALKVDNQTSKSGLLAAIGIVKLRKFDAQPFCLQSGLLAAKNKPAATNENPKMQKRRVAFDLVPAISRIPCIILPQVKAAIPELYRFEAKRQLSFL